MTDEESTANLMEQQAVIDVMSRYARGIDRRDAELYLSCLADPIDIEIDRRGGPGMKASDWLAEAFEAVAPYTSTQHLITNHDVHFPDGPNGDRAVCNAYLQAQHWRAEKSMLLGGRYENGLSRHDNNWQINRLRLRIDWIEKSVSTVTEEP